MAWDIRQRSPRIIDSHYHLSAWGNERRDIFRDETDHRHFLELLVDLPERFANAAAPVVTLTEVKKAA